MRIRTPAHSLRFRGPRAIVGPPSLGSWFVDVLEQLKSALTGRYHIEREIGQGGMATVYLARDVRHDRPVALKILNPELGAVLGVERFLSEIRVTANLQHPHLLPLFDSGEAEGHLFYVMPYVDGESLRERLKREKQLPVDEAIRLTVAVASALDYAHRHGVIHRDLKPENILLLEGQPLVADFGIALAVSVAGGARVTQTGISLGTPHYMSPEQATGDRVPDGRADVYSLGAVLYEMLTGDPPHTGNTAQAIIAKVITDKPRSIRLMRETVSPNVEAAVERALAKLPADRFATAQDFADALTGVRPVSVPPGVVTPGSIATPATPALRRRLLHAAPWAVAALAIAAAVWERVFPAEKPQQVGRFVLALPDSTAMRNVPGAIAVLTPDGSRLVYVGGPPGGRSQLFVRNLRDLTSRPLRGTEGAVFPSISPDGQSVLYSEGGRIRRIDIDGGAPVTVSDSGTQASWGDNGVIVYVYRGAVYRTTPAGSPPVLVMKADSGNRLTNILWPHVLPGGKTALFAASRLTGPVNASLSAVNLATGSVKDLGLQGLNPRYIRTGHVLFGRQDGTLNAVPFDARQVRITGKSVPLLEDVVVKGGGAVEVAVADNGTLVYRSGVSQYALVLVDRKGTEQPLLPERRAYLSPRISPDGKRIAMSVTQSTGNDIWVYDRANAALTRLTQHGGDRPEWSADGKTIYFQHNDSAGSVALSFFAQPWDASGDAKPFIRDIPGGLYELSIPMRGRGYLAARVNIATSTRDIWIAPVDSPKALRPFLASPVAEYMPSVSPDGRWLAYVSAESGQDEVYVKGLPGPGGRVQVSVNGGSEPLWSPTGRELFYISAGDFMSAQITWNNGAARVVRQRLFAYPYVTNAGHSNYSVTPDGSQFVFSKSGGPDSRTIVVVNWFGELRERMSRASK